MLKMRIYDDQDDEKISFYLNYIYSKLHLYSHIWLVKELHVLIQYTLKSKNLSNINFNQK